MADWPSRALSQVMRPSPSSKSAVSTRRSSSSREKNNFDTDFNDVATTVAASESTDTMEVGQLTSPQFSQEREVSANPLSTFKFAVKTLQDTAFVQQASVKPVRKTQDLSFQSLGIVCEALSHFQTSKGHCRKVHEIENWRVCNFLKLVDSENSV